METNGRFPPADVTVVAVVDIDITARGSTPIQVVKSLRGSVAGLADAREIHQGISATLDVKTTHSLGHQL